MPVLLFINPLVSSSRKEHFRAWGVDAVTQRMLTPPLLGRQMAASPWWPLSDFSLSQMQPSSTFSSLQACGSALQFQQKSCSFRELTLECQSLKLILLLGSTDRPSAILLLKDGFHLDTVARDENLLLPLVSAKVIGVDQCPRERMLLCGISKQCVKKRVVCIQVLSYGWITNFRIKPLKAQPLSVYKIKFIMICDFWKQHS